MAATLHPLMEQYVKLTEFLGQALGPDYEIALHDLSDKNRSIIAIANNHISGREVGAPLTNMALGVLRERSYERSDYRLHYCGMSAEGKRLRSCTFFIKQDAQLLGMLCINFDDSRYRELSEQLLGLSHPDHFVNHVVLPFAPPSGADFSVQSAPESFRNSTDAVTVDAIHYELARIGVTADRLNPDERLQIIGALERNGIFLLKGAVKDVATVLHCSQASVYRYLAQVKGESAPTES